MFQVDVSPKNSGANCIEQRLLIEDFKDVVVAVVRNYPTDQQYIIPVEEFSLEKFMDTLNALIASMPLSKEEFLLVSLTDKEKEPLNFPIKIKAAKTLESIASKADLEPSDIINITVDNEFFSLTHETEYIALMTAYDLGKSKDIFFEAALEEKESLEKIPELVGNKPASLKPLPL